MNEPKPLVVLGVSASVAAFKAVTVLRLLTKSGLDVALVPTQASYNFVGPATWQALASKTLDPNVFASATDIGHVEIAHKASAFVLAPASANTIARLAAGLADDMLCAIALALDNSCPKILAPAMHPTMWNNPATVSNIKLLESRGWKILLPQTGMLADYQVGDGRLVPPEDIHEAVLSTLNTNLPLAGKRILISAGGTREPWDEVRYLGNRSSGRQGCALARQAVKLGGQVDLVVANVAPELIAAQVNVYQAPSAQKMLETCTNLAPRADLIIMCAAVADFRPLHRISTKISRHGEPINSLELEATPDVLDSLCRNRPEGQIIVGFAAQTGTLNEVLEQARVKALRKNTDFTVANLVSSTKGFETSDNEVFILNKNGEILTQASGSKDLVAQKIFECLIELT